MIKFEKGGLVIIEDLTMATYLGYSTMSYYNLVTFARSLILSVLGVFLKWK